MFFSDKVFCDIILETQDGFKIFGHKVILASASPYFLAMFTHFEEKNKGLVVIRDLDSSALQLIVDFIYSGKIIVTERNVQVNRQTLKLLWTKKLFKLFVIYLSRLCYQQLDFYS